MRYLFINAVCGIKSTGRICAEIGENLELQGNEVKIAYGRGNVPQKYARYAVRIGSSIDVVWHAFMGKYFFDRGLWSKRATDVFLQWADKYDPDVLWIHNIHDYFINIESLLAWIKKRERMQVIWTHHDCWAITGQCCYFSYPRCDNWKTGCVACKKYGENIIAKKRIERNLKRKKELFSGIPNMKMITPSYWLAGILNESFMTEYPITVCHNTINTNIFKPTDSDFRQKYNIEDKFIVLGVASPWSARKGLSDFIQLSQMLSEEYVIVLVGVNNKQAKKLPRNIISIPRTDSAQQLAEIYSCSDVFLNLTYEDNYPTTNLEAQACGTPAITYRTGGSPESVPENNVCEQGDLLSIVRKIEKHEYSMPN